MKKALKNTAIAFIVSASLLTLTSCNKEKKPTPGEEGIVSYDKITFPSGVDCDLDLTVLSTHLKNQKVFDILCYHDEYVGKTVKLDGRFLFIENSGKEYYACEFLNIEDEYDQFLEFVLEGDKKYPDDYPKEGDMITVLGTLEKRENGIHLVNAKIVSNDGKETTLPMYDPDFTTTTAISESASTTAIPSASSSITTSISAAKAE